LILFFSDLHIDPLRPDELRQKILIRFLNQLKGVEKIFLVGDVFDFWFEYRYMVPSGYIHILDAFAELINRGIEINFIKGNHDQWAGSSLSSTGINVYDQKQDFECYGIKIHLAHGDFLDRTVPNQLTQFFFKSKICRSLFGHIPHEIGFPIACHIAQRNRNFKLKNALIKAFDEYAREKIAHGSDIVIMGHLHYPIMKRTGKGVYVNIGDWVKNMTYLVLKKDELFLKKYLDENLSCCKIERHSERRLVCQ